VGALAFLAPHRKQQHNDRQSVLTGFKGSTRFLTPKWESPLEVPLVLEIKGNSLDDGPGIRSVVFFKGCPLSCGWCHNPESKRPGREIGFDATECIGCNTCLETCPEKALSRENPFFIDRNVCSLCFACVETCPSGALSQVGRSMTIDSILKTTLKDKSFFNNSNGGVTLSGGEPTLFLNFASDLLKAFKRNNIHTLLETCGLFDLTVFEEMLYPFIDTIYYDIKLIDAEEHSIFCGAPNHRILANFRHLQEKFLAGHVKIIPRTPLIPGITDTQKNLTGIAQFLQECKVTSIQLLAYHPLWQAKNQKIGHADCLGNNPEIGRFLPQDKMDTCRNIFETAGIQVL
jgi:pyruvate formate lyase activating enzyme